MSTQAKEVILNQSESAYPDSVLFTKRFSKLVVFMQIFFWPAVKLISFITCRKSTNHIVKEDIHSTKSYVIAASHGSMLDAFVILHHFAFRNYRNVIPCRFFVHNGLFNAWLTPILIAFGSFPAKPHPKWPSGLTAAERFLRDGQSVLIFPEGKRYRGEKLKPRKGVAVLAALPNVEIIPVKITWKRGLLGGYEIVIGKPQNWSGRTADAILFDILTLE